MKNIMSNLLAVFWFFGVLIWTLFILVFANIYVLFSDILGMLASGVYSTTVGFVYLFIVGVVFGITGLVPSFRKCYYKLPWLYPFSMIMTMNLVILSIAEEILAKGFQVISTPRHIVTILLMIAQIILCRLIMCIYLNKNPLILHKYDRVE